MKWSARCGLFAWIVIGAANTSAEGAKHVDLAQGPNQPPINETSKGASPSRSATPPLVISEFLARNFKGIKDEDGQTSDWIELYNPGPVARDLAGWHLTDSMSRPDRWTFPATNLEAKSYLLVFASGKNRSVTGRPLHANFKLRANGGSLGLFDPNGELVDSYTHYPPQEANISFGRVENRTPSAGESAWRYFLRPSPRAGTVARSQVLGAVIREVSEPPVHSTLGTPIKITTSIAAKAEELGEITLHYCVMFDLEKELPMAPEDRQNSGGDGVHTFSAVIPGGVAGAGQMIRWYVTATVSGVQSRWPLNAGALPSPRYLGTVVEPQNRTTALPVYDFFVEGYRFPADGQQESGIDSDSGGRGALFAYGKLYDNVFIRIKGTTSRHLRKQSHRIDFNPGHEFRWDKEHAAIRQLSLNAEYPDPSYARQNLSCWLQREAGTGAAPHFPVRAQINGRFWQLAFHTMPAGEELLRFMGLDPHGALYKQVEQIAAQPPGRTTKQTRKLESRSDYQAFVQAISERQPLEKRRAALYDLTDLPTVINYIATARITHEADDVWANMVLYRDSNGTGEWRPIPFDLNLSFGQLFYDGDQWNTVINATNDSNKSHPLYGSSANRTHYPANQYHPGGTFFNMFYNRLYDAVIRVPETRSMLLRRLRSLMDQFLKPPGTPPDQLPIEKQLNALAASIAPEAELDRKLWGWPPVNPHFGVYGLGANYEPARGIADIKNLYLAPRRVHLYSTHSVTNTTRPIGIRNSDNAGIPLAQPPHPVVKFGVIEASPTAVALDEDYVQLVNTNSFAVDITDWRVEGALNFKFKPGTVLAPGQPLYLSPKVVAFRARKSSPKAGEACFVQGDCRRNAASVPGRQLVLRDATGTIMASTTLSPADTQ